MRILITGASGFVARHLIRELEKSSHAVLITSRKKLTVPFRKGHLTSLRADLSQPKEVASLVQKTKPDAVVHLAALPHVGHSWKNPSTLVQANIQNTRNLCEALAKTHVHLLFVSSAMVYGDSAHHAILDENSPLHPMSPYGISKLAAEIVVNEYASPHFKITIVRPFNHTGPGQSEDFVCPAFALRIAGAQPKDKIPVGNLDSKRDFTDVRDIVRAYRLILEKKPKAEVLVLGSGRVISIKQILQQLIKISGKKIQAQKIGKLLHKKDLKTLRANPALARRSLGWSAKIPMNQTLRDIYFERTSSK